MTKKERATKWDTQFIPCTHHPDRRCNRSGYVGHGGPRCGSCKNGKSIVAKARKKRHAITDKGKAMSKRYDHSDKGRTRRKHYKRSAKGKAADGRFDHSDKGKIRKAWYVERKLHG